MRRAYQESVNRIRLNPRVSPLSLIFKALSAHIRPLLAPPLSSPVLATLETTKSCNLRCSHCEVRGARRVTKDKTWQKDFVKECADKGVLGMGFTGGEPLLDPDFEELARIGSQGGMLCHLNTNGVLITPERAASLIDSGLSSINISMDGASCSIHDSFRGTGSFDKTLKGIQSLVQARDQSNSKLRILLAMTLSDQNAREAAPLLDLCQDLGASGCTFLPLSRFRSTAPFACRKGAEAALVLAARAKDPRIDNSKKYLRGLARRLQGAWAPCRCSALNTSILVSEDKKLYPCVPSSVPGQSPWDYVPGTLMATFKSGVLGSCINKELCRSCWWNCHRELDIALRVI